MKTVLVIDDEFGIVDVLVSELEDQGYRVFTAANGRRGLDRLAETRPDLIISDFMMPLMDGAAMARAIRADPAYRNIPIILMSGLPEAKVRERFADYEAFLQKPFNVPVLLDVVAEVLKEGSTRRG